MTEPIVPAPDHEPLSVQSHGQSWLASWHPAGDPPPGRPHGSAGDPNVVNRRFDHRALAEAGLL
ncbi:hypothetical protein AB0J43_55595 [Nonomuraea fuscirosea]